MVDTVQQVLNITDVVRPSVPLKNSGWDTPTTQYQPILGIPCHRVSLTTWVTRSTFIPSVELRTPRPAIPGIAVEQLEIKNDNG